MSCVTDGLLHWANAANNTSLFVEGRSVNEESIVNLLIRLKGNSKRIRVRWGTRSRISALPRRPY